VSTGGCAGGTDGPVDSDHPTAWRLLTGDAVSASSGLAADELLAHRAGTRESPPTLRLYTYRSHCALVGRFQNVEREVDLSFCSQHGIQVNRRPTGGGAILMGADQLGVALALPGRGDRPYGGARQLMQRFCAGLIQGLDRLGVRAAFRRKNDLEIGGRKIAGLGIYRDHGGGLLFHASLLVDLDVGLMLQVLRIPAAKLTDKLIRDVAARTCTLRGILGSTTLQTVRDQVADGYARSFGVDLTLGDLSNAEQEQLEQLADSKYRDPAWIMQRSAVPDGRGRALRKTPAGLIEVTVATAGRMIKAVQIGGDFFADEGAVADLEGHLRWHSSSPDKLLDTVREVYGRSGAGLSCLPMEAVLDLLADATRKAIGDRPDPGTGGVPASDGQAYGCFVTPGGTHA